VDPDFASNGRLIFYYSAAGGTDENRHRVASYVLGANGQLDMGTERVLVTNLRGPANHDGGAMAIGPDGKLYVGVGDTGCNSNQQPETQYTPTNFFATCLTNGNGKVLRVNLDGTIPPDNPLSNVSQVSACGDSCRADPGTTTAPPRTDVWVWGFRNPWRFWFDPQTGNLWLGDVGEISYEEINVIPPNGGGRHYGWPWREGAQGHPASACRDITPDVGDCVDPAYYCKHGGRQANVDSGCDSITGGVIIDSCEWPAAFRGRYYFSDNSNRNIYSVETTANRGGVVGGSRQNFATASGQPVHIAIGPDGALYWSVIAGADSSYVTRAGPRNPEQCATPDGGTGSGGGGAGGSDGSAGAGGSTTGAGGGGVGGAGVGGSGVGGSGVGGSGVGGSGVGGSGVGGSGVGGSGITPGGNAASGGIGVEEGAGCGCRVAPRGSGAALFGLALLGLLSRLRHRRR
jgi:MYXO-CTERM domain-containing protein